MSRLLCEALKPAPQKGSGGLVISGGVAWKPTTRPGQATSRNGNRGFSPRPPPGGGGRCQRPKSGNRRRTDAQN
jgi:hypothetical protein